MDGACPLIEIWSKHSLHTIHFFFQRFGGKCHSFYFFLSVSYIHNHINTAHSLISIRRGLSPFSSLLVSLRGKNLPGVPSRDLNSGLHYSRPAHYQLNQQYTFYIYGIPKEDIKEQPTSRNLSATGTWVLQCTCPVAASWKYFSAIHTSPHLTSTHLTLALVNNRILHLLLVLCTAR